MAIESRTSIGKTRVVTAKHDVDAAGPDDQAKRNGKKDHARGGRQGRWLESRPVSNYQGQLTGKLIDVVV